MVYIGRQLPGRLAIQKTRRYLRFTIAKKSVFHLFFLFKSYNDMDRFFQLFVVGKFPFITKIESGE